MREEPYWQAGRPAVAVLPKAADVVIVGSGYTGLSAGLAAARAGRSVVVLDAGAAGRGCSTRNGAHISTSIKLSRAELARKFGPEAALAIRSVGREALDWLEDFVAAEKIDCGFARVGRYLGAHSPRAYEAAAREADIVRREEGAETFAVPHAQQRTEIGSDYYHGGVVYPRYATLDAGAYHAGLLAAFEAAGGVVVDHCAARAISRAGAGFDVETASGRIHAGQVAVATNGYSGDLVPWLTRRVIPIGSYVIATEDLGRERMAELFPTGRMVCDTRKVVYYYGPNREGTRIIFGGRVTTGDVTAAVSAPRLVAELERIFPQIAGVGVARSWMGRVAFTFDSLPHCGQVDGVHYCMGYCGSGVSLSGYLGMRMGQRMVGLAEGRTALDDLPFPTRPFYTGRPWFMPAAVAWYRLKDRLG